LNQTPYNLVVFVLGPDLGGKAVEELVPNFEEHGNAVHRDPERGISVDESLIAIHCLFSSASYIELLWRNGSID